MPTNRVFDRAHFLEQWDRGNLSTAAAQQGRVMAMLSKSVRSIFAAWRRSCFFVLAFGSCAIGSTLHAAQVDWQGPEGSRAFGTVVKALPNGNIVVTDPAYTVDGTYSYGAVHLYRPDGERISTLTGKILDYVGSGGVFVVGDSNFVVCSPGWRDTASNSAVGAATWVDGNVGLDGDASTTNSLTGSRSSEYVCQYGVTTLANGHYVVASPLWADGVVQAVGAVSWCDGNKGCRGTLTAGSALTGTRPGDHVGQAYDAAKSIFPLPNGDYAVVSSFWSNGDVERVGAVTLCGGQGQCNGLRVGELNSVVGARTNDLLGGSQSTGPNTPGITVLKNGDFVINSVFAQSAQMVRVGAITRVAGSGGLVGAISASNSLFGTRSDDFWGASVTALETGNYVINVPNWDNDAIADAGASVLCSALAGCVGGLSAGSGLVGSSVSERIGYGPATALANGNYLVASPFWSNSGIARVGAVTLCDGHDGCSVDISVENSLVGSTAEDLVGVGAVVALSGGGYVVSSPYWDKEGVADAGAVTHCAALAGCVGPVTVQSSLTGNSAFDEVGQGIPHLLALRNGNYVAQSIYWTAPGELGNGAVTWGNGQGGTVGVVSMQNSFVGIRSEETFGGPRLFPLSNGDYVVSRRAYTKSQESINESMTLLRGYGPQSGSVSELNSVVAVMPNGGPVLSFDHDAANDTLIVGNPWENKVTLLSVDQLFFSRFD